jgi:ubiquinone/menaquinone biosynthesis C-methylase UbiE
MARHSRRYDRVAGNYSQYRPRYPDRLVAHLAGIIGTAPAVSGASIVLDVGSGTGAFTRRLRAALPSETRIVGIEPSPVMRAQAIAETAHADALAFVDGAAEAIPVGDNAAGAVVAATAAHWFDRPQFYADAHRVLMPGGVLAIVAYVRDEARSPLAAALVAFMARHGSPRAYAPTDYRQELAGVSGFGGIEDFVLRRALRLGIDEFVGLALSSSHAAGVVERFGGEGARDALRDLAAPHRIDDAHVRFGYLFQCITVRRDP